jgi:hypothetical protein
MDDERFDTLVRPLPVAASRRAVGHSVAAAVFGGVLGVLGLAEAGAHDQGCLINASRIA